jgi:hypothetical protein
VALAIGVMLAIASPAFAATYDALNVIPYDTWRASSSMTAADIQTFLSALPGPLGTVVTSDYAGVPNKTAAQIIWEAARAWNLNPKVILATLQKEEGLLTLSDSNNAARLNKAMGCGVYPGSPNTYPGFGNQVWNGARKLSTYEITYNWFPGKTKTVTISGSDQTMTIVPLNASTFALYTYTPYYPQKLVWDVYVRYFGDPSAPPRLQPVYRFQNRASGAYLYTISEGVRYSLIAKSSRTWSYGGAPYSIDTSSTVNTRPLYRLYNTRTHAYAYTISTRTRSLLLAVRPRQWTSNGSVGSVSPAAGSGDPVYRLENKLTHAVYFTRSSVTKARLTVGRSAAFYYRGIAFYLGHSEPATAPVGP